MATYRSRSRSAASSRRVRRPGSPLPRATTTEPPLFRAIEDFSRGNLPHNDELKGWLSYLARSFDVPGGKLSPSGQALMRDLSRLVGLLRSVVEEKNRDELLQRFFYHAKLAARLALQGLSRTGKIQIVKEPRRQVFLFGARDEVVAERARKMRKEALKEVRALYRLVQFLLGSSEFREVVGQSQALVKKIFASKVRRERPQRVQFAGRGGEVPQQLGGRGTREMKSSTETPMSPKSAAELDEKIKALRSDVKSTEAAFRQQAEIAGESGYVQLSGFVEVTERTTSEGEYLYQSKGVTEGMKGGLEGREGREEEEGPVKPGQQKQSKGKREIRRIGEPEEQPQEEFPEATEKQTAENPIFKPGRQVSEEEEFYQAEEEPEQVVPEQEEQYQPAVSDDDEIVGDMKRLFTLASANPEFQRTIRDAFAYLRALQATASGAVREPTGPIPGELQYEENIKAAQRDLLHLLERFANGKSVEPLIQIAGRIQREINSDYELKDFFGDWMAFMRRCLKDPAYLESEEYDRRAKFLLERTRAFAQSSRYRDDFDEANDALNDFLAGWQQDHLTRAIGDTLQRIVKDDIRMGSTAGQNGLFLFSALNPDLIGDFRHTILPSLLANLHELPLPRIESLSDGTRLVLENIVIPAGGFVPVDLDVRSQARLRMSPRERLRGEKRASAGWQNGLRIRM